MIPYGRQQILKSDIEAVGQALRKDLITTGSYVEEFEQKLTDYVSCPTFVVNSGTAALHAAYWGAGIGPGDEIITPANTFIATQASAALLGARIVFADIEASTGLLSLESAARKITDRTKAIVLVDYAGQPCDIDAFRELTKKKNILLIEDAAHSLGSMYKNRPVGSLADITTFSFFPTKNITTGEGGAVSSIHPKILNRAKSFARQGLIRSKSEFTSDLEGDWVYEVHDFGLNYRLTDFQCALGLSQLERIGDFKKKRKAIFESYLNKLKQNPFVKTIKVEGFSDPMWHLFPISVPKNCRKELFNHLRSNGIGVQVNYIPTVLQPVFKKMRYQTKDLPNTMNFYHSEISMPIYPDLTEEEINYICSTTTLFFSDKED
jgi:dTDP-4-amino-4,6-dideoxygalactose transaminase